MIVIIRGKVSYKVEKATEKSFFINANKTKKIWVLWKWSAGDWVYLGYTDTKKEAENYIEADYKKKDQENE